MNLIDWERFDYNCYAYYKLAEHELERGENGRINLTVDRQGLGIQHEMAEAIEQHLREVLNVDELEKPVEEEVIEGEFSKW